MSQFLLDTDVLIDFLRGQLKAVAFFDNIDNALISAISVAELYVGARTSHEETELAAFLHFFQISPVNEVIAKTAGQYRRKYGPSHGSGLADCIIAATTYTCHATLVTRNKKHFPMLKNVLVPY